MNRGNGTVVEVEVAEIEHVVGSPLSLHRDGVAPIEDVEELFYPRLCEMHTHDTYQHIFCVSLQR